MFQLVRPDLGKARELAERLFTLAQTAKDTAQLVQAHQAMVVTSLHVGDPATAHDHMVRGMALYDPKISSRHTDLYGQDPAVVSLAFGAVALWLLGSPDQAVERSREAIALGKALGQPSSLVLALYFDAVLKQYRRDPSAVEESVATLATVSAEHGLSFWQAGARTMRGWTLAEQGSRPSGIAQIRQGLSDWLATGGAAHHSYHLALLAEALGKDGQIEEALDVLARGLDQMQASGEAFHGAELHRLQGELLLRQKAADADVEDCFRRSLALARKQQARSFELRTIMSLTRLFQKQGRQAEARPMLAECYRSFTEGFDTPDLREATELLGIDDRNG
jgi:predicted ATPase